MGLPEQGIALICVASIFPCLAVIAVALRVDTRRRTRQKLDLSDYFIFFTLFVAILDGITCIIGGAACGLGQSLEKLSPWMQARFMKILFAYQFMYIFSVWGVKMSVLFFYRAVFGSNKTVRKLIWGTMGILAGWIVAFFFATLFQDDPIQRNWGTEGTTVNWRVLYIVINFTDLILDIWILTIPAFCIRGLHVSTRRKWQLAATFGLGFSCVIASTVRLVYMFLTDKEYNSGAGEDDTFSAYTVDTVIWGAIEPCTSIIAACLPIITAIFIQKRVQARKASYEERNVPLIQNGTVQTIGSGGAFNPRMLDSIDVLERSDTSRAESVGNCTFVEEGKNGVQRPEDILTPPGRIHVQTSFHVQSQEKLATIPHDSVV